MNRKQIKLFSTAASLMAAVAVALCELLHPCFHSDHAVSETMESVWTEHHVECVSAGEDSFCPVCSGTFLFCAAASGIVIPEAVYPEVFQPEAQSFSAARVTAVFSRGPPCCNTSRFSRI